MINTDQRDTVDSPHPDYKKTEDLRDLVDDLMGGTSTMQKAGDKWLPREPKESRAKFRARTKRSILFNALRNAVRKIAARPFSRPTSVQGEVPDRLSFLEQDIDFKGMNLTRFGHALFKDGVRYGVSIFYVDFPETGGQQSLADEQSGAVHPYFVRVNPRDLFSWTEDIDPVSKRTYLKEVRFKTKIQVRSGQWKQELKEYIVVWAREEGRTRVSYYMRGKDSNWVEDGERSKVLNYPGLGLPFVVTPFDEEEGLTAAPPLEDLAWLNLAHWQSNSDQRNILRFARLPILFQRGISKEEADRPVELSVTSMIRSTKPEADMKYVEHSGKAIEAGAADLKSLEEAMEVLALEPFVQQSTKTATEAHAREGRTLNQIQMWVELVSGGLTQGYAIAAEWMNETLPDDFRVKVFNDFGIGFRSMDEVKLLATSRMNGDITQETYLSELKRRGILSDSIDVLDEIEQTEVEAVEPEIDENSQIDA